MNKKVIVITGGAGVLGTEISSHFIKKGHVVCVIEKNNKSIIQHDRLISYISDVTSPEILKITAKEIYKKFGKIDVLINAAGGNHPDATISDDKTIFDLDFNAFNKVTDINLNGTVISCIVFGELMVKNKTGGSIINYSSMSVERTLTRVVAYSASKAGVQNFTRWLAVELSLKFEGKVRVNAISPGFFLGKQNMHLLINEDGSYTKRAKRIIDLTPMKRFGEPEDLNGVIEFLCAESSKFITGAVIPIDGGFSAFSGV
jgi:NAD(P)-dependent dehydrogenase (short-subunit alcohol dehydrogenase family)